MNHIQTQTSRLNTYESTSVGLGPLVQEDFGHPMVTAVGCYMKGGQVVQRDVVDLSVVLQQLPHTVHVVPLSCHVDGRQTVLRAAETRCVKVGVQHI